MIKRYPAEHLLPMGPGRWLPVVYGRVCRTVEVEVARAGLRAAARRPDG